MLPSKTTLLLPLMVRYRMPTVIETTAPICVADVAIVEKWLFVTLMTDPPTSVTLDRPSADRKVV